MKKFHPFIGIIICILPILLFSSLPVRATDRGIGNAGAEPRKTVRVGYFIGEGFQEVSPVDGHRSGYCYEYLQTLSYYTGWQYEYVETSWAGALERIASGEIDILAQVSMTEERKEFMLYADRPMGAEDYYLYVLPGKDRKLRADDITTLNHAKVGINAGSYQLQTFREWCELNEIGCEIVESEDEEYRTSCFYNGDLDAIVDNDFYLDQGWIPLYKTGTSDYYICVTKSRPDLLDDLNAAQEKLYENSPLYIEKLQTTYFPHDAVSKALSDDEMQWLKERQEAAQPIRLGYIDDYLPFSSRNKNTGKPEGVITLFVDSLKEKFGIEVECVPYADKESLYEAVQSGSADAGFPLYDNLWQAEQLGIMQTDAFIEFPVTYIFRKNEYDMPDEKKTYAVSKTGQMQSDYVRDKHPEAQMQFYDNYDDCMNAIAKGEVDGMYMSSFVLSRYYESYQKHSNLDIIYQTTNANLCFGVNINACPELLTIFNKNNMLIDDSVKTSYLVRNTQTDPRYTIVKFLKTNALIIMVVVLVISVLIIAAFSYQLKRVRMAQIHEKEAREIANEAFEAANRANQSKTDFLSSMSHDIRTPMNAIVGMTAIATANIENSEKVKHCLSEITTSSEHLLGLINDILDMNKIEAGKVSLSEAKFNLKNLVDDLALIVKPLAEERGHSFDIDVSKINHEVVIGDSERLHQCLVNFISNSIKYTPNGGRISFTVTEHGEEAPDAGSYVFVIEDNGIGMSEDFVKVMFDPFTRDDHKHVEGQQGTGLGMSIARNIIRMMNGEIDVKSKPDEGTRVTLTFLLPYGEGDEETTVHKTKDKEDNLQKYREENFSGIRILLAEDNEINAEIAEEILKMTGMTVEHAWNGKEALDKMVQSDDGYYKLILMDIQMPVMDGYEATKEIRAQEREYLKKIPIIAMSANAFAEDIANAKAAGMNDHVAKPLNLNKLLDTLKKYIGEEN